MPLLMQTKGSTSRHSIAGLCIACLLVVASCSENCEPPFIKAQVIDVYNNKTDIYNARFFYWWQERGETAFLDTYSATKPELLVSIVRQNGKNLKGYPAPVRLELKDIRKIEWHVTETGKKMLVYPVNGPVAEAVYEFPQYLRVDAASGLADYTCSITGSRDKNSCAFDYRQDLNYLKSITVTEVDEGL